MTAQTPTDLPTTIWTSPDGFRRVTRDHWGLWVSFKDGPAWISAPPHMSRDTLAEYEASKVTTPQPTKRLPQTDSEAMGYADAQSLVTLLAFGDRSKMTPEDVRTYADALSGLLSSVTIVLPIDATWPIMPALRKMRDEAAQAGRMRGVVKVARDVDSFLSSNGAVTMRGLVTWMRKLSAALAALGDGQ